MNETLEPIESSLKKGDYRRAEQLLEKISINHRDDAQVVILAAKHAYLTGKYTKSITLLETLPPEELNPETRILFGDAYFARYKQAPIGHSQRTDADYALQHYHSCTSDFAEYEDIAWVYYKIGLVLKTLNEQESACSYFRQSLNMPSQSLSVKSFAYEQLAQHEFYIQRDFKQALQLLELAIAVYTPDSDQVWFIHTLLFKAKILQVQQRFEYAFKAVELAIKHAQTHFQSDGNQLADIYFKAGELTSQMEGYDVHSEKYMQSYLQLRPKPEGIDISWSRANEVIANMHFTASHYRQALTAYIATLQYNPYHPWQTTIHYQIARCYYHEGDYPHTISALQQLLDTAERDNITVTDFRVYDMLGSAYFALGDFKAAAHSYREALKLTPPHPGLVDKIKLYWHYSQQLDQQKDEPK